MRDKHKDQSRIYSARLFSCLEPVHCALFVCDSECVCFSKKNSTDLVICLPAVLFVCLVGYVFSGSYFRYHFGIGKFICKQKKD